MNELLHASILTTLTKVIPYDSNTAAHPLFISNCATCSMQHISTQYCYINHMIIVFFFLYIIVRLREMQQLIGSSVKFLFSYVLKFPFLYCSLIELLLNVRNEK